MASSLFWTSSNIRCVPIRRRANETNQFASVTRQIYGLQAWMTWFWLWNTNSVYRKFGSGVKAILISLILRNAELTKVGQFLQNIGVKKLSYFDVSNRIVHLIQYKKKKLENLIQLLIFSMILKIRIQPFLSSLHFSISNFFKISFKLHRSLLDKKDLILYTNNRSHATILFVSKLATK